MNKQSAIRDSRSIVVVGAGPAGASLAIRLAQLGFETTLIERERFPRQKLCGEFISPECFRHFDELGLRDDMLSAGGDRISETRFFEVRGKSVSVPSSWFGQGDFALSLSRAEMDNRLLRRAREVGVRVLEGASVTSAGSTEGRITSLTIRGDASIPNEVRAHIFVDATGRSGILAKLAQKKSDGAGSPPKPILVGFKSHLQNVDLREGLCEIYSFPGGYAGVSHVEDGLFNLCFLLKAETVRSVSNDANELVRRVIMKNKRAASTLHAMSPAGPWLAVSIDGFGVKNLVRAANLYSVGDAAAFIDPFTGSGMVMAFESSQLLADSIVRAEGDCQKIGAVYGAEYQRKFARRLRVCAILRRTAFMPNLATGVVSLLAVSAGARKRLAQATRGSVTDAV